MHFTFVNGTVNGMELEVGAQGCKSMASWLGGHGGSWSMLKYLGKHAPRRTFET